MPCSDAESYRDYWKGFNSHIELKRTGKESEGWHDKLKTSYCESNLNCAYIHMECLSPLLKNQHIANAGPTKRSYVHVLKIMSSCLVDMWTLIKDSDRLRCSTLTAICYTLYARSSYRTMCEKGTRNGAIDVEWIIFNSKKSLQLVRSLKIYEARSRVDWKMHSSDLFMLWIKASGDAIRRLALSMYWAVTIRFFCSATTEIVSMSQRISTPLLELLRIGLPRMLTIHIES